MILIEGLLLSSPSCCGDPYGSFEAEKLADKKALRIREALNWSKYHK